MEALDLLATSMTTAVANKKAQLDSIKLSFPEETYNSQVKQKLALLDQLTGLVVEIQKTGSGKGIVASYRLAIEAYESFGNEIMNFAPEGKGPEYVTSFKKAMSNVYTPILQNAKAQRAEVKKLIESNKILSENNSAVMWGSDPLSRFYQAKQPVTLMDRGGKR